MRQFPACREIHGRSLAERRAILKDPEFRRRVRSEELAQPLNADAALPHGPRIPIVMDAKLTYEPLSIPESRPVYPSHQRRHWSNHSRSRLRATGRSEDATVTAARK